MEKVVDSKKHGNSVRYNVRWKGYGPEWDEWVPIENLANAKEALEEFIRDNPRKPHNMHRFPALKEPARARGRRATARSMQTLPPLPPPAPIAASRGAPQLRRGRARSECGALDGHAG